MKTSSGWIAALTFIIGVIVIAILVIAYLFNLTMM